MDLSGRGRRCGFKGRNLRRAGTSYPAFMQDLNQFYRTYPFRKPTPPNAGR
jgi:hypothetical protein